MNRLFWNSIRNGVEHGDFKIGMRGMSLLKIRYHKGLPKKFLGGLLLALALSMPLLLAAEVKSEDMSYLQAVQLFNQKKWNDAQKAFEQFQKEFPNSRWKYAARIRLADMENNPGTALKLYQEVLQGPASDEWKISARWSLAQTYYTLGQYQNAADQFQHTGQTQGMNKSRAYYMSGLSLMALDKPREAKIWFAQAAGLADNVWAENALVGVGDASLALHDPAAGSKAYELYLQKNPNGELSDQALLGKTQALKSLGQPIESARVKTDAKAHAPEELEPAKKSQERNESAAHYTLQLGAFSQRDYAKKLQKKLNAKGYKAFIVDSRGNQDVFHQVRVGDFPSRETAQRAGEKIEKKEKLPFLVLAMPLSVTGKKHEGRRMK
jgi:tetratricopeptide (TPR) repeat protein